MKRAATVQQEPLFNGPPSAWIAPKVSQLPVWSQARRIAVDCETRDDDLKTKGSGAFRGDGKLVGVSFALDGGPAYYLPLAHYRGGNVSDPSMALMYLRKQAAGFSGTVVGMNLPYDLGYLMKAGVLFDANVKYRDVRVNEALIDEFQNDYSLQGISQRYLMPGKDEYLLSQAAKHFGCDPKAQLWALPAKYVGPYAEQDARLALEILDRQQKRIDEQHLGDVVELESQVLPVILKMQARGVRVNMEKLARVEKWALEQEADALEQVFMLTGHRIAVGDSMWAAGLAPALTAAGVSLSLNDDGQPHIDKFVLEGAGPVGGYLTQARKVAKLGTFAASIREHEVNGRIHCTFNQLVRPRERGDGTQGARFGRISCSRPNLQQQPSRDDFANMWRDIYEPEEGGLWGSADYSQQEPRMQTHYAVLEDVPGAREAMAEYHNDPNLDHHDMMAKLTGLERKYAKNIYLGLCYGMGSGKLARSLGLPVEVKFVEKAGKYLEVAGPEAMAIIRTFRKKAPHVTALAKVAERQAQSVGYLVTIGGRVCRFPKNGDGYDWTYKAMNRLIQGSSADQTKMAMVALDNEGFHMQLQIHDSIEATVSGEKDIARIAQIMKDVLPLKVPCKVDYKIGQSWGSIVPPAVFKMARLWEQQGGKKWQTSW